MNDYFDREVLSVERELVRLKTAAQKSSQVVDTVAKTVSVNVPLSVVSGGTTCKGEVHYAVSCDTDSIIMATLNWYHGNIYDEWQVPRISRAMKVDKVRMSNDNIGLIITAYGTNYSADGTDDLTKLKNGQSVTISASLTVRCTDNFTVGAL